MRILPHILPSTADFSAFAASRRHDDDDDDRLDLSLTPGTALHPHPAPRQQSAALRFTSHRVLAAIPLHHTQRQRPCNNPPVSILGLVNHPQLEVSLDAGPALCHYLASNPSAVIYFIGNLDITPSAGHNRCLPPHFSPPRISGSLVPSLTRASLLRGVPLTGSPPLDNSHATL